MGSRGINKVILVGKVGVDPEVRTMGNGKIFANLTIATSDSWFDEKTQQNKEVTEWHRVVVYGSAAKIVQNYVRKGSQLYIEGKLKTRNWEDQSGKTNYMTEIHVDSFNGTLEMLGNPPAEKNSTPAPHKSSNSGNNPPPGDYSDLPQFNDTDDIPF